MFGNADYGIVLLGGRFLSFEFDRILAWRDVLDLYRQRQFRRTNHDYHFQYFVRHYFYTRPLLRRNDHVYFHESACRGVRVRQLAEKPVQKGQTRSTNRQPVYTKMVDLYRAFYRRHRRFVFRFTVFRNG